jgi:hypothetical protein
MNPVKNKRIDPGTWIRHFGVAAGFCLLIVCVQIGAQTLSAPKYKFDPDWPKPLPNHWKLGGIAGLAVDKDDNVWVLNRPSELRDFELRAELNPPTAECCVRAPSMIHFDKEGNVIGYFDEPEGHGMVVDSKGFAYIGQDTVRKYDTKTGKLVGETPRAPEKEPGGGGGAAAERPRIPGRGGARSGQYLSRASAQTARPSGRGGVSCEVSAYNANDRGEYRRSAP